MKTCNGNKTQDSDFIKTHPTVINKKNSGRVSLNKNNSCFSINKFTKNEIGINQFTAIMILRNFIKVPPLY